MDRQVDSATFIIQFSSLTIIFNHDQEAPKDEIVPQITDSAAVTKDTGTSSSNESAVEQSSTAKGEENPASTNIKTMTIRRVKQNWGDIKVDPQFTGEDLENTDDEGDLSLGEEEVIEEDEELNKEEEEEVKDEVGEEGQAEGVKPEEMKTEESVLPKEDTPNTGKYYIIGACKHLDC